MDDKLTFWDTLCNFINIHDDGGIISREEIKLFLIENKYLHLRKNGVIYSGHCMDVYRRYLTVAGYLSDTDKRGVYKKVQNVPTKLSMNRIRKQAYGYQ